MATLAGLSSAHIAPITADIATGGIEVIDRLADEWRVLCQASEFRAPFHRPEWIAAYVRAFAPSSTVVVATVRRDGRLAAVLPLIQEVGLLGGLPARKLRGASNVHTCRYDLVHRPADAEAVMSAIWDALRSLPGWDVLELPNVPIRGAIGKLARHARACGHAVHAMRAVTSPYVDLQQADACRDHPLLHMDAKFRSNLRRRMRKLESRGAVTLIATNVADERIADFYELERNGWKGAEESAISCNAATRHFYDEVAKQAANFGYLSVYTLECAGRPVAMHFGLKEGGSYFLLKTAYDETVRTCSPGQLITHEVLCELAAQGCRLFDFLGLMMDWKRDWVPRLRPHADWYLFRGPAGRLLHALRFGVRPAIGRTLRSWRQTSSAVSRPAVHAVNSP